MGQSFGTASRGTAENDTAEKDTTEKDTPASKPDDASTIEITSVMLASNPKGKVCDALDLRFTIAESARDTLVQKQVRARWLVDLEVDVAHLQQRLHVCTIDTHFQSPAESVFISRDQFVDVVQHVAIENMSNVCVLHVRLVDSHDVVLVRDLPIVMHVSHDGYQHSKTVFDLSRRLYDIGVDIPAEVQSER